MGLASAASEISKLHPTKPLSWLRRFQQWREELRPNLSWRTVELGVVSLASQMQRDGFHPAAILAVGRGGLEVGQRLTERLSKHRHVSLLSLDRAPCRGEELLQLPEGITPSQPLLLICGVNASGHTLARYSRWLRAEGFCEVKTAVLAESRESRRPVNYCFRRYAMDPQRLVLPWYRGQIARSRNANALEHRERPNISIS